MKRGGAKRKEEQKSVKIELISLVIPSFFFFLFSLTCSRCDSGDELLPLQGFKEAKIPCRKSIAKALPEDRIRVNILKEKKKVKI